MGTSAVGAVEDHGSCFKFAKVYRAASRMLGINVRRKQQPNLIVSKRLYLDNNDLSVTPEWLSKLRNLKGLMPQDIRIIQQ